MIDLKSETVIPARRVPDLIGPIGRNGSRMHPSKVMRGILKGLNGHKLEAVRCGSHWLTSVEAVGRWLQAQADEVAGREATPPSVGEGRKAAERATRELDRIGI